MDGIPAGADLSQIPIAKSPNGSPPNFVDPPSLLPAMRGLSITFTVISLCFVVARLTIYTKTRRPFGLDDAAVITAWIFSATYTGVISAGIGAAVCRHAWDTPLSFFTPGYAKVVLVESLWYGPMMFFAKTSILLLYIRVFNLKRWLKYTVYLLMAILFCVYWVTVPLGFVYCVPHGGDTWGLETGLSCAKLSIAGFVQGSCNIAADITIFILPLPIISKLEISRGKKLAMTGIFATGLFALTASILTMVFRVYVFREIDSTWQQGRIWICIQAELSATIWVACMPSLAKVLNTNFKQTKIYKHVTSIAGLLSYQRGSSQRSADRVDSINSLERHTHQVKVEHLGDVETADTLERHDQIYKLTTYGVSVERDARTDSDGSAADTL